MTQTPPTTQAITPMEVACMKYLSDKMEATAFMVGRSIWDHGFNHGGSNIPAMGAAVLGRLKKKGLVMRLPELKAWRLTREGREYVKGK